MKSSLPDNPETCPRCYVGRIQQKGTLLSTIVNGELLSIPNFPTWVCDMCHISMYDPAAIAQLRALLVPLGTPSRQSKQRKPKLVNTQQENKVSQNPAKTNPL